MTTWQLIKLVLKRRCNDEGDWYLRGYQRAWYTFKALVCILLDRPDVKDSDNITVACFNGKSYLSYDCAHAYGWEELYVSRKGFRWSLGYETNC